MSAALLYSDVEEQLRASVRDLLSDRAGPSAVLARIESGQPYDRALWTALAIDLGVAGLPVAEALGGHGASWRETAVVAEELGRSLAATPFLGSAVLATALAAATGADDITRELATGSRVGAVVLSVATVAGAAFPSDVQSNGGKLTGSVRSVLDAVDANLLLVPALEGGEPVIVAVSGEAVRREHVVSLDLTRPLCDIAVDDAVGDVIAAGQDAVDALESALVVGAAMLAAEQLGLAQACLEMSIEHLTSRYQFGRPIGGYQALKHRAADVWASVTQARAVARYAASCVADGDSDASIAASVAQAYCSPMAVKTAEENVQFHGGIGFTWEHPAHLYLKRAKADAITLGGAAAHRRRLAPLVNLPVA